MCLIPILEGRTGAYSLLPFICFFCTKGQRKLMKDQSCKMAVVLKYPLKKKSLSLSASKHHYDCHLLTVNNSRVQLLTSSRLQLLSIGFCSNFFTKKKFQKQKGLWIVCRLCDNLELNKAKFCWNGLLNVLARLLLRILCFLNASKTSIKKRSKPSLKSVAWSRQAHIFPLCWGNRPKLSIRVSLG